ncbi:MAG: hypothetical protein Q4B52_01590 [Tissierellia bacterium]|nr:hypothetical protein [Tissierellia bacterium]
MVCVFLPFSTTGISGVFGSSLSSSDGSSGSVCVPVSVVSGFSGTLQVSPLSL